MKNSCLILLAWALLLPPAWAQIKIGGTGAPTPSAVLELESTSRGFLPPRMSTAQRDAISGPTNGMVVFNTTLGCLQLYNGGSWICLGNTTPPASYPPRLTHDQIEALPSPQPGDVAFDLTFGCLRYYFNNHWVCSDRKANDPTPDAMAWRAGGASFDYSLSVAVDGAGNVYVTGYFEGTASFGSTTLNSAGGYDVFVAKYSSGGVVQWAQRAGGTGSDEGRSVAVDGAGNVYVTGNFYGNPTFGSTTLTSAGGSDMFLAKYDQYGNGQWAQSAGGTGYDVSYGLAVDGSGNVYVTGYFSGTANFGSTTLNSAGGYDVFVAKYSSGGVVQWAQRAGGSNSEYGYGLAVDGSGNVYVTGYFSGTASFGSTTLNSAGSQDVFLVKYDQYGNGQWAQRAGGTGYDECRSVAVDGGGNVYLTGTFSGSASFGSTTLNSAGEYDVFVAKYSSGGVVQWAQSAGGSRTDVSYGVAVDGSGNVYVTGYFERTANFGSTTLNSAGGYDVFVAKYSSGGVMQWAQRAGGVSQEVGYGVAVDGSGNVYVTGYFSGTASFGSTTLTSTGGADVFVVRYKE